MDFGIASSDTIKQIINDTLTVNKITHHYIIDSVTSDTTIIVNTDIHKYEVPPQYLDLLNNANQYITNSHDYSTVFTILSLLVVGVTVLLTYFLYKQGSDYKSHIRDLAEDLIREYKTSLSKDKDSLFTKIDKEAKNKIEESIKSAIKKVESGKKLKETEIKKIAEDASGDYSAYLNDMFSHQSFSSRVMSLLGKDYSACKKCGTLNLKNNKECSNCKAKLE